jgi:hypothetical protein
MPDPIKTKPESTEEQYVSPTSDETLAERYERVRKEEAQMTNEERLRVLRESSSLFEDFEETED